MMCGSSRAGGEVFPGGDGDTVQPVHASDLADAMAVLPYIW
jgi:hypothetical protein